MTPVTERGGSTSARRPTTEQESSAHAGRSCALCSLDATDVVETPDGAWTVLHVDNGLIALYRPGIPEVVVAQRSHTAGLAREPRDAGRLLAALRRVARVLEASPGASGSAVEPVTNFLGTSGHTCYHVAAVVREPLAAQSGQPVDVRDLVDALR